MITVWGTIGGSEHLSESPDGDHPVKAPHTMIRLQLHTLFHRNANTALLQGPTR